MEVQPGEVREALGEAPREVCELQEGALAGGRAEDFSRGAPRRGVEVRSVDQPSLGDLEARGGMIGEEKKDPKREGEEGEGDRWRVRGRGREDPAAYSSPVAVSRSSRSNAGSIALSSRVVPVQMALQTPLLEVSQGRSEIVEFISKLTLGGPRATLLEEATIGEFEPTKIFLEVSKFMQKLTPAEV